MLRNLIAFPTHSQMSWIVRFSQQSLMSFIFFSLVLHTLFQGSLYSFNRETIELAKRIPCKFFPAFWSFPDCQVFSKETNTESYLITSYDL